MNVQIPAPNLLYRYPKYVHLYYRNDPMILGYRVRIADSLDNAYGTFNGVTGAGTEALFDLKRGVDFVSKAIADRKIVADFGNNRNQTHALYDPNEYYSPPATTAVPPDERLGFLRTQVRTLAAPAFPAAADPTNQSAIKILPPAFFLSQVFWPAMPLTGTAPNLAGLNPGDMPPEQAMRIQTPPFARNMILRNDGGTTILYSVEPHMPLVALAAGDTVNQMMGTLLSIVGQGGTSAFTLMLEFQTLGDQ